AHQRKQAEYRKADGKVREKGTGGREENSPVVSY
ncbi:MAG: hypothetical protein JWP63_6430, partial [Candidatus Solibacter sp.]|nr:hypothetical protein [Candidatus Solibacter sp.]